MLNLTPNLLSDHISTNSCLSFIKLLTSPVVAALKSSKNDWAIESKLVFDEPIDLIANIDGTIHEKEHSIHRFQFIIDYLTLLKLKRLKMFHDEDHVVLVTDIIPCVVAMSVWIGVVLEAEELFEVFKEFAIQEVRVNGALHIFWQLLQEFGVITDHSLILVVLPFVVKIVLHIHFELDVQALALVELDKEAKELREVVAIIK